MAVYWILIRRLQGQDLGSMVRFKILELGLIGLIGFRV